MGAILLNGARIGRNSLVGAGALVPEGKEFPENRLIVGAPARVVRPLDRQGRDDDRFGRGYLRPSFQALCRVAQADRVRDMIT